MIDFNNFNENISDEMLAAYIDGNTTFDESSIIQNALGNDELLTEVIDIANDSAPFGNGDWGTVAGSFDISEFALSSIASLANLIPLEITDDNPMVGESLFGDSSGFELTAVDSTDSIEDSNSENENSNSMW